MEEHFPWERLNDDRSSSGCSAWATEKVVEEAAADSERSSALAPASLSGWSLLLRPNRNT